MKTLVTIGIMLLALGCSSNYKIIRVDVQRELREEYYTKIENLDTHEDITPKQMASHISRQIMGDRRLSKESKAVLIDFLISTLSNNYETERGSK